MTEEKAPAERRPVVGWEGLYEVSSDGRVYSLERVVRMGSKTVVRKARELRTSVTTSGYTSVSLCHNGRNEHRRVHRLVALAFLPNPNGYTEVNHKNANRLDPRLENLEWCTSSQNKLHAFYVTKSLTIKPRRKLSDEAIEEIRRLHPQFTKSELARRFGVNHTTVANIVRGISWKTAQQPQA